MTRYAAVFAAAYRLTSDRGTAEEVVQNVHRLVERAESFDAGGLAGAWPYVAGTGRSINARRVAVRRSLRCLGAIGRGPDNPRRLVSRGSVVAGDGAVG
jgi:DNA-directed RNA polymerase specialized sigma24 family protein